MKLSKIKYAVLVLSALLMLQFAPPKKEFVPMALQKLMTVYISIKQKLPIRLGAFIKIGWHYTVELILKLTRILSQILQFGKKQLAIAVNMSSIIILARNSKTCP